MTPQEKAKELYIKFQIPGYCYAKAGMNSDWRHQAAKEFVLMVVDEIIESRKDDSRFDDTLFQITTHYITPHPMYLTYWLKVKEEIEKL